MSVKVNINRQRIVEKVDDAFKKALPELTMEILDDCNEYCKWAEGALVQSSYVHSIFEKGIMIWQTPYAKRQYWEIKTANPDYHSKATWKWAEVAKSELMGKWTRQADMLIKRNMGD